MQAVESRHEAPMGKILAGFFLSGFLMALLGAILPAWGYHRDPPEFITVGNYFLCLGLAVISAAPLARWLLRRWGVSFTLVFACSLACAALLSLALVPPPAPAHWRMAGLAVIGLAAGLLNTGLFHAASAGYVRNPGETVAKAGILFGFGCLAASLLVAGTFYAYTVPSILVLIAVAPGLYAGVYAKTRLPAAISRDQPTVRQAFRDFRSPGAVIFALLLFFQFGNEWSLAGWLPLFLVRRLGISPTASLLLLALYWMSLLVGRMAAVYAVRRVHGSKLLGGSVLAALFGLALLFLTNNGFGAGSGVLLVGGGFAGVYPLVAEMIGRRFPYFNPAFFNGIFSFALMGGMLAPATLGYFAELAGIGVVMALPLAGTFIVLVLLFLVWVEAKATGR
ncbi:MAG TPA: MFS transporter [Bryobacteraceae bacterium]|nr:MFS transporter [Bryobacteraceae bacterium]